MANMLFYYLIVINVVTFLVYGIDKWNPRTRELTVRYDANKTSARTIKHFMA